MSRPLPPLFSSSDYPGFLPRLLAYLTDTFILALLLSAILWATGLQAESHPVAGWVSAGGSALYFIYCHGRWGMTPGKAAFSLKLISIDGKAVSYTQALLRYSPYLTAGIISALMPALHYPADMADSEQIAAMDIPLQMRVFFTLYICWHVASVVYMLQHPQRRTLHDKLAYTVVTRREEQP